MLWVVLDMEDQTIYSSYACKQRSTYNQGRAKLTAGATGREGSLNEISQAKVDIMQLDLASSESVPSFAKENFSRDIPMKILM
ncbi:hypothetical protein R1flu_026259 [Riccia fluitans]|uniref:Uncharacterized protein n=1 Tax=Riccia fluitans TaxID=41844 RepID=A0ABD1XFF8_9MARC